MEFGGKRVQMMERDMGGGRKVGKVSTQARKSRGETSGRCRSREDAE